VNSEHVTREAKAAAAREAERARELRERDAKIAGLEADLKKAKGELSEARAFACRHGGKWSYDA